MKYSKGQIYILIVAALFLVGAVFMLINTFAAGATWALWAGLCVAGVASVFYVLLVVENRKEVKKKLEETSHTPPPPDDSSAPFKKES